MARKKVTKISPTQWERFQRHVVYWQVLLGLQHWGIICSLASPEEAKEAARELEDDEHSATIAWECDDYENQLATIYLVEDWTAYGGIKQHEIDKAAFHEVCHLLFCPLEHLAGSGSAETTVRQEIHRCIRVLENTFYENQKKELADG